ncbi:MAG: hypothetical protein PVG63_04750 [Anaerolineales bacterium]
MLNNQTYSNEQRIGAWVESGLLDLLLSLLMLGFGIGIVTGMIWLGGIFVPAMLPALINAQQSFAARLPSTIQLQPDSRGKLTLMGLLLVGLLSVGVGLMFLFAFSADQTSMISIRAWFSDHITLAMGIFWAMLFAATGWIVKKVRYGLYAGLALTAAAGTQFLTLPFGAAILATGCVIMLASFISILLFLKTYPRPAGNS